VCVFIAESVANYQMLFFIGLVLQRDNTAARKPAGAQGAFTMHVRGLVRVLGTEQCFSVYYIIRGALRVMAGKPQALLKHGARAGVHPSRMLHTWLNVYP